MSIAVVIGPGLLSRDNLSELMTSLGHPEDEVELESLMHNWDVKGRQGFLDFDAFLSIVSATLKVLLFLVPFASFEE